MSQGVHEELVSVIMPSQGHDMSEITVVVT